MKNITIIIYIIICNVSLSAQNPNAFITTWQVEANDVITIPLQNRNYDFDYTWRNVLDTAISITGSHTNDDGDFITNFVTAGVYTLEITGDFPHLADYPKSKLLDVLQWGNIGWRSMEKSFLGWPGTTFSAIDAPDLTGVNSMNSTFDGASNFNGPIGHWDVSNVNNFFRLFRSAAKFNQDISGWNVSKVTNMNATFEQADSFNQAIGIWDVGNVTSMNFTFSNNDGFNQDIGDWNVSKVRSFASTFRNASSFNQNLGSWTFSNDAINTNDMFSNNVAFDCQNWSGTIIGWVINNPTKRNLAIGGPDADYDEVAGIAREALINRGWTMIRTHIGGDCNPDINLPSSLNQSFEAFPLGELNGNVIEGWKSIRTEAPEWTIRTGDTPSLDTGPAFAGAGNNYIFLETSLPAQNGQSDTLTSPMINLTDFVDPELSFLYHMFGANMGSLKVELTDDFGVTWTELSTINGQQQTSSNAPWIREIIPLRVFNSIITLRFIGFRDIDFRGDMAIDDIRIVESGTCYEVNSLILIPNNASNALNISWGVGSTESEWLVSVTTNQTLPEETPPISIDTTFIDSLDISIFPYLTPISVHVRGVCELGDSTQQVTAQFIRELPIINDQCEGAIPIPTEKSCLSQLYSFSAATNGPDEFEDSGIWFKAVVPSSGILMFNTTYPGTNTNTQVKAFEGGCSNLSFLSGDHDGPLGAHEQVYIDTRPPGDTIYYVVDDSGRNGNISVCAVAGIPSGDDCASAVLLEVDTECSSQTFSFDNATNGPDECSDIGIWFMALVPPSGSLFFTTKYPGSNEDQEIKVFKGNCGEFELLSDDCQDDDDTDFDNHEEILLSGETPGDTLYFVVDDRGDGGSFSVCLLDPGILGEVSADSCEIAIPLEMGSKCEPRTFSFDNMTNGTNECSDIGVWFKVIVPESGNLIFSTLSPGSNLNTELRAFTGECGNLTEITSGCQDDDNAVLYEHEHIQIRNQLPGETIYFMVDDRGDGGTFSVCVYER